MQFSLHHRDRKVVLVKARKSRFDILEQAVPTPGGRIGSPAMALDQGQFSVDDNRVTKWPKKTKSMKIEFQHGEGKAAGDTPASRTRTLVLITDAISNARL